ncbi:galactose oxidase early set domain-containing protein [Luteipulveratus mongoliensis]|uniref:galactose oxidase early set domain-containing protein n=1 Tax=Luteipulveratus mongoliensis TaxID=571913 RepID=UPI0006988DAC|nr:galactose oxidase early set domain-containing protein [Luteipulveratus mongoliensis]
MNTQTRRRIVLGGAAVTVAGVIGYAMAQPTSAVTSSGHHHGQTSGPAHQQHVMAAFTANGLDPSYEEAQRVPDGPVMRGEGVRPFVGVPASGDPVKGSFSPVVDWPIIGIHAVVLPDGRVFSYGSNAQGAQTGQYIYDVWDPKKGTGADAHQVLPNRTSVDIFCSAQLLRPDGKVEIYGGDVDVDGVTTNKPNADITTFQPSTNTLTRTGEMQRKRWYASATTLHNGQAYVQGGSGGADHPEVREASGGTRLLTGVDTSQLASGYPRNFVRTDGTIFGISAKAMYSVNTAGVGSLTTKGTFPATNTGGTSSAVMYEPNKILQVGGGVVSGQAGSKEARVVDISAAAPVISSVPSMASGRHWSNATVLADGRVFVDGGSSKANAVDPALPNGGVAYTSELFNPKAKTWASGPTAKRMRLYHGTSTLLRDGSVLTMGGGAPGPQRNLNAEIYYPPYLFTATGQRAARPKITYLKPRLAPASAFSVASDQARSIRKIALVKTGSTTHSFNLDQRRLELSFSMRPGERRMMQAQLPSAGYTPPGYYMVFLIDDKGVPSEAGIVNIAAH